jgi:hypothetical protein
MEGYVAIKRSINNDNIEPESDEITMQYFNTRSAAANWLVDQVEIFNLILEDGPSWADSSERKTILKFFLECEPDAAFFQWEWKRRGNCRTYRIVPAQCGTSKFFLHARHLYKLKEGKIKESKTK